MQHARSVIAAYNGAGRLPNLALIGKDPLAIQVHFHNMFYAYAAAPREIKVLSGIDMALWDLAGKILNQPVSKLLGGNFRDEILLYSHATGGDYLSKEEWRDRAQRLLSDPRGFKAYKVDIHHALGINMQEYTPSIGPVEARRIHQAYTLAREAFGGHRDRRALSLRAGRAQRDQGGPGRGTHQPAVLRRSAGAGVVRELDGSAARHAPPHHDRREHGTRRMGDSFPQNQAVDIFQPDIINSGGITGVKMIADLAARYRIPIALHNVSGLMLNMASQQLPRPCSTAPASSARPALTFQWATKNPIVIKNGHMKVGTKPGLGMELDQEYLKTNRVEGEPWWG